LTRSLKNLLDRTRSGEAFGRKSAVCTSAPIDGARYRYQFSSIFGRTLRPIFTDPKANTFSSSKSIDQFAFHQNIQKNVRLFSTESQNFVNKELLSCKFVDTELDELYDEFSHWLENPDGKNPDKRDVAVFRFAHSLLKRALSDSFASVAMKIENFSDGKKNIKLSSSAKTEEPSSGRDGNSTKRPKQRSRSLAEDATDDRMVLQLAKELLHRAEQREEPKLTCNVVSIVLEQNLAEVELQMAPPARASNGMLPAQDSLAWEYHQNPECIFNIRLDRNIQPIREEGSLEPARSRVRQLRRSMAVSRDLSRQWSLCYAQHLIRRAESIHLERHLTSGDTTNQPLMKPGPAQVTQGANQWMNQTKICISHLFPSVKCCHLVVC
jgi:hypothetical protein